MSRCHLALTSVAAIRSSAASMSGQTCSCLARYSASRSGRTRPRKQTRSIPLLAPRGSRTGAVRARLLRRRRPARCHIVPVITGTLSHRAGYPATDRGLEVSEVELADVRGVEGEGRAEQDRL